MWESLPNDDGAATGLLWTEIFSIMRRAQLTLRQREAVINFFKGLTYDDIATAMGISDGKNAQTHVTLGLRKMSKLPHKGIITVVYEAHGWDGVYWVMHGRQRRCPS